MSIILSLRLERLITHSIICFSFQHLFDETPFADIT